MERNCSRPMSPIGCSEKSTSPICAYALITMPSDFYQILDNACINLYDSGMEHDINQDALDISEGDGTMKLKTNLYNVVEISHPIGRLTNTWLYQDQSAYSLRDT